jgi:plasmid stability protein
MCACLQELAMASITIRNFDDRLKRRLRVWAAEHGRSMEEKAWDILGTALNEEPAPAKRLGTALHELFRPFGGVDLATPPCRPMREPQIQVRPA